jgi:hypothetical protein
VTSRRYANYTQALALIRALDDAGAGRDPIAQLLETAEALLLLRARTRTSLEPQLEMVASLLRDLVEREIAGVETATRLWRALLAAGPPGDSALAGLLSS